MAIGSGVPYNEYTGNGVSTVYAFGFTLLDADDLAVTIDGTPTSDYTISGLGVAAGGSITFSTAPANGTSVVLEREIALVRATEYQTNGDLQAATVNDDFNRLWLATQQTSAAGGRAIRVPELDVLPALPAAASRANTTLGFDSSGNPTVLTPVSGSAADVLTRLADNADAAKSASLLSYNAALAYASGLGQFLNYLHARTASEISASVTPSNYAYFPGDVRRYGAVVNGSTDDAAAITLAFDQFAAGGAPVYLPGVCYVASGLSYDAARGLQMYGDGWSSGLKGASAGTYIILLIQRTGFTAITGVSLREFSVDGNNGGQLDAGLVQLNNCTDFLVDHVKVGNTTKASGASGVNGITCSAGTPGGTGSKGAIQNCLIYSTSKAGINWTSQSVQALIVGNEIRDMTGNGTAPGIQINGGAGARVVGNYLTNTQGPGIYVSEDGSSNYPLDTIIASNIVTACGATSTTQGDGIRVTASSGYTGRVLIQGNSVSDCGTNTNGGSGIYAINTDNVTITGNLCRNNRFDGVRVEGCNHALVSGNRLTGNNLAAVSYAGGVQILGTCGNVSIIGNHCSDDKGTATQSYGIILTSGTVLTSLTIEANHLEGNLLGPLLADAGAKPMRISMIATRQSTDGAAQTAQYFALPDDGALLVHCKAVGKKSDGSDRAIYSREALFYRDGGALTQQGSTTTIGTDIESDGTWGGLTLSASGGLAVAQVAGVAATTVDWRVVIEAQTV